jgi:hypothetical protein
MPENPLRDGAAWQVGQVAEFSPETHTYTVTTSQGTLRGVPRLLDHPGDVVGLARDTRVAVHRELGFWIIAGILNEASAGEFELAPIRVTEVAGQGADNPVATPPFADARAPEAPTDVGPEDWVRHGELGQLLALLKGGSAVLRASPLAQVRAHQENDLVEVISHLYRHITAMGEAKVSQDGGRLTYTWRAGANVEHAGASVQNWTIRLDVGAGSSGDIFSFSITTPQGQTLARISMSPEGRLELRGTSLEITAGAAGTTAESLSGSRSTRIGGSLTTEIGQDLSTTVNGTSSTKTSKDESHLVGGSRRSFTVRNGDTFIGGTEQRKVLGGAEVPAAPGALASVYEFVNGGVELAIGNPSSGAVAAARQGLQCVSYVGGLDFVLQPSALPAPQGGFNVISAQPASVNLGVDGTAEPTPTTGGHAVCPLPAPFAVMKYEPWLAMMQVLLRLFDSHIHATPKGPSGPPVVPLSPAVSPLLSAIRSVRVGVGL